MYGTTSELLVLDSHDKGDANFTIIFFSMTGCGYSTYVELSDGACDISPVNII